MLFFMTGLQSIDPSMYDAASIDGASNTQQFFKITIPLLGPVTQMVLMNAILGSLKVTDLVLTLTDGKPSGKTEVMMTYIYKQFFSQGGVTAKDWGFGAALTVVTAVILSIVTVIYLRATKKSSDIY
jgi:raffinose/stachyose/melibiose transport system permease protein